MSLETFDKILGDLPDGTGIAFRKSPLTGWICALTSLDARKQDCIGKGSPPSAALMAALNEFIGKGDERYE